MNANSHLPPALVKSKVGKVVKRQPYFTPRTVAHYKAECSFRELKTSGPEEELPQILWHREAIKDAAIQFELAQLQRDKSVYEKEQEVHHFKQWWNDRT
jgi:hypothetical protein